MRENERDREIEERDREREMNERKRKGEAKIACSETGFLIRKFLQSNCYHAVPTAIEGEREKEREQDGTNSRIKFQTFKSLSYFLLREPCAMVDIKVNSILLSQTYHPN